MDGRRWEGDDYLLEMVPGADPLGMILFCVAVDESLAEDMMVAQAKICSNKRKMREELGLKADDMNTAGHGLEGGNNHTDALGKLGEG